MTTTTPSAAAHASYEPTGTSVAAARSFVRATLRSWGADEVLDAAVLLTSELVTNAVVHAGTQTDVTCLLLPTGVRVEVLDRYPARTLPIAPAAVDTDREGGRGLFLSNELSTSWGVEYTSTAKRVWFQLAVRGQDIAAGSAALRPGQGAAAGGAAWATAASAAGPEIDVSALPSAPGEVHVAAVRLADTGAVVAWDAAAAGLFGWPSDEARLLRFDDLTVPTHGGTAPALRDVLSQGRWHGSYGVRHRDGRVVPVYASHVATVQPDEGPTVTCLLVLEQHRAFLAPPPVGPSAPGPSAPGPARGGTTTGGTGAGAGRGDGSDGSDGNSDGSPSRQAREDVVGDDLVQEISSARLGLDELLQRAVERARDLLAADAAFVLLATEDEAEMEVRATTGLPAMVRRAVRVHVEGAAGRLESAHLPLVVSDATSDAAAAPLLAGTGLRALVTVPLLVEGRLTGTLGVAAMRPDRFDNDDAVRLQRVADRIALSVESARLAELERMHRGWLSFLAEASELLAGSLDHEMTLAMVAQLCVPRLASWCVLHTFDDAGTATLSYVWHADEARIDPLRALLDANPPPAAGAGGVQYVTLSAPPAPAPDPESNPQQADLAEVEARLMAELATDMVISLPLLARGRSLGAITLGRPATDPFRRNVVELAEDLSRRAAFAVANAQLYRERSQVSQALQRSLLPPELPVLPGCDVAVAYEAAGDSTEVGGDFYDVFTAEDGLWCFAVGDVCGKGAEAAAVTGLARQALRILFREGHSAATVVERLNAVILAEGPRSRFLTLLCGEIRPRQDGGLRLALVCAGHPLPLRVQPDGTVSAVAEPQPLLGVVDGVTYDTQTVDLEPGDLLVCFTDGVTERRNGDRMLGEEGLARLLADTVPVSAAAVAARVQRAVLDFAPEPARDDLAVVVLRAT